jgi:2-C-methyl-D-erythritol 2,4-cyclodiphosphate synthase
MNHYLKTRVGIGQDSHRFLPEDSAKPCIIGGIIFEEVPGLAADSDGDVVLHALCNAITSLTGVPILGGIAAELCHKDGITDSQVYLKKALATLGGQKIEHVSIAIEGKRPRLEAGILSIRIKIAEILQTDLSQVGLTITSGDGLTDFGCGDGLQCFSVVTTVEWVEIPEPDV